MGCHEGQRHWRRKDALSYIPIHCITAEKTVKVFAFDTINDYYMRDDEASGTNIIYRSGST